MIILPNFTLFGARMSAIILARKFSRFWTKLFNFQEFYLNFHESKSLKSCLGVFLDVPFILKFLKTSYFNLLQPNWAPSENPFLLSIIRFAKNESFSLICFVFYFLWKSYLIRYRPIWFEAKPCLAVSEKRK